MARDKSVDYYRKHRFSVYVGNKCYGMALAYSGDNGSFWLERAVMNNRESLGDIFAGAPGRLQILLYGRDGKGPSRLFDISHQGSRWMPIDFDASSNEAAMEKVEFFNVRYDVKTLSKEETEEMATASALQ